MRSGKLIADEDIRAGWALTCKRVVGKSEGVWVFAVGHSGDGPGPLGVADRDYRKGEVVTPAWSASWSDR